MESILCDSTIIIIKNSIALNLLLKVWQPKVMIDTFNKFLDMLIKKLL